MPTNIPTTIAVLSHYGIAFDVPHFKAPLRFLLVFAFRLNVVLTAIDVSRILNCKRCEGTQLMLGLFVWSILIVEALSCKPEGRGFDS
jgi:hypothetical protein